MFWFSRKSIHLYFWFIGNIEAHLLNNFTPYSEERIYFQLFNMII